MNPARQYSLPAPRLSRVLQMPVWSLAMLVAAVLVGAAAVVSGETVVILAICVGAVAAPFLMRADGGPVVAAVAAIPLSSLLNQYGTGIGGYKIVVGYCLACWGAGYLVGWQTIRFKLIPLDIAIIGLFTVSILNILFLSAGGKVGLLQWYIGDLALYLWVRGAIFTRRRLWWTLASFASMGAVAAGIGFVLYGSGLTPLEENLKRLAVPGQNINTIGSIMLVTGGFALALLLYEKRRAFRVALAVILIAALAATILTFSRGAFVGMVMMLAAGLAVSRSWRLRLASATAAVVSVLTVWFGLANSAGLTSYVARVTAITNLNYATTAQRNVLWSMGWRAFTEHWLFGLGIGNFYQAQYWFPLAYQYAAPQTFYAFPQAVHSFYIGWAADVGVVGLVFLAAAVLITAWKLYQACKVSTSNPALAGIANGLLIAFAGYFLYLASSPEQNSQLPYVLIGLCGTLSLVVHEEQGRAANAAEGAA